MKEREIKNETKGVFEILKGLEEEFGLKSAKEIKSILEWTDREIKWYSAVRNWNDFLDVLGDVLNMFYAVLKDGEARLKITAIYYKESAPNPLGAMFLPSSLQVVLTKKFPEALKERCPTGFCELTSYPLFKELEEEDEMDHNLFEPYFRELFRRIFLELQRMIFEIFRDYPDAIQTFVMIGADMSDEVIMPYDPAWEVKVARFKDETISGRKILRIGISPDGPNDPLPESKYYYPADRIMDLVPLIENIDKFTPYQVQEYLLSSYLKMKDDKDVAIILEREIGTGNFRYTLIDYVNRAATSLLLTTLDSELYKEEIALWSGISSVEGLLSTRGVWWGADTEIDPDVEIPLGGVLVVLVRMDSFTPRPGRYFMVMDTGTVWVGPFFLSTGVTFINREHEKYSKMAKVYEEIYESLHEKSADTVRLPLSSLITTCNTFGKTYLPVMEREEILKLARNDPEAVERFEDLINTKSINVLVELKMRSQIPESISTDFLRNQDPRF